MNNKKREVECLQRMEALTPIYEQIWQWLLQVSLVSMDELKAARISNEQAKLLQSRLSDLSKEGKLQMLEYEWVVLPVERIRILLVTDTAHREFTADA